MSLTTGCTMNPVDPMPTPEPTPVTLAEVGPETPTHPHAETPPPLPAEHVAAPAIVASDQAAGETVAAAVPDVLPPAPPPVVPALPPQQVPQVPVAPLSQDLSRIAQDLQIRKAQVEAVIQLLDDANTVPFITRYRKERTGGLDEVQIRRIQDRVAFLRDIANKKQTILRSIANQGKLNDDLVQAILAAEHMKRLDDLYLPYKVKKRTLASDAREKGLEPLALAIWTRDPVAEPLDEVLKGVVDPWKQLHDVNDVLTGVKHIIAEVIAEMADVRGPLRAFMWDTAELVSNKADNVPEGKGLEYRDYYKFKEPIRIIPPHRVLAVNRGERENIVRLKLEWNAAEVKAIAINHLPLADHPHREMLYPVVEDALGRLMMPSLEREIRRELTEHAQDHAVDIFSRNLSSLLMRPPLGGKRVLAIDPGIRTGCKVAVLDETGTMIDECVIYPHPPQKKVAEAKKKLEQLIRKHQTSIIAIGNGTACRETEQIVSDLIAELEERRLNPPPAASPIPQITATTPTIETPKAVEIPAATHTETMPGTSVEMSAAISTMISGAAETTLVLPGLAAGETAMVMASPLTEGTTATATVPTATTPAEPPAPPISLEGLPPAPEDVAYVIVNEAGASDYSASPVAKEEFPNLDATTRGTISIGRRLQDPLSELVKVDPQHVGVGLYQHDVRAKYLKESVEKVIESCVNNVGVDVNTASVPLLRHVSGLNQLVARQVVEHRTANGPFKTREQLKSVAQMGDVRFTQAAGFLKIRDGDDPLDTTWVHPESYELARQILTELGFTPEDLKDRAKLSKLHEKLNAVHPDEMATKLNAGIPTVRDIYDAIARPGRDPREDRPQAIFRKGVLKLEDLATGMELRGEVLNVVDFGAFVDVGLKDSGLVHISQMANRYIKSPYDVIAVGDVVSVWVMNVDTDRRRVSLTMISPGQERRPPERAPRGEQRPPRQERSDRPPQAQGDRQPQGDRQQGDRQQGDRPPQGERPPRQDNRPPRQDRPPMPQQGQPQGQPQSAPPMQQQADRPPPRQFSGGGGTGGRPGGGRPQQRGPGSPGWRSGPGQTQGPPPRPGQQQQPPAPQFNADGTPFVPVPVPGQPVGGKKPPRAKPTTKLSDQQKAGKAPVHSFAQLAALIRTKAEPEPEAKPVEPAPVETQKAVEEPKPE